MSRLTPEAQAALDAVSVPVPRTPPTEIERAYDAWWRGLTRIGDPMRRPNLTREAFEAGYLIAVALHAK